MTSKIVGHLTNYYGAARKEPGFQESRVDAIIEHKGTISGFLVIVYQISLF